MTTASKSKDIGIVPILIVLFTLFTAAVHLYLGILYYDTWFVLNGLGYLGLLGALFLPIPIIRDLRFVWRWLLVGYAALTIILYFVINQLSVDTLGLVTKAAEVLLIVSLVLDRHRDR
ncbi:MAG: hypothetical protein NZ765_01245 [Anaerolineae bacterium]|nr:hypothetical protein [Anaerolineae bacterium]MDW8070601.1 hypothetical protein [Anaerolineae bacterium]